MNAKELYARFSSLTDVEVFQHRVVIARALSLLASVEDGEGIVRELEECERIVGNLCADGRCPKMSIPVRDDDEDMRLTRTMKQAAARITLDAQEKADLLKKMESGWTYKECPGCGQSFLREPQDDAQEKAALKGQADVLDALNTSQAHEISLLKAELASVKDHAEAMYRSIYCGRNSDEEFAADAYRAAFPKEGA